MAISGLAIQAAIQRHAKARDVRTRLTSAVSHHIPIGVNGCGNLKCPDKRAGFMVCSV
jgi:hypothetical protein